MTTNIEENMTGLINQSYEIIIDTVNCPWRQNYLSREANLISRWKEAGFFVETDLNDINCYWLKFEPAPVIYHMALAVLFLVIFFVGSVSNGIVIFITSTSRHLWTPVNIIIVNLAFSDFLMLSCLLLFVYNSMVQGPAIGYQGLAMLPVLFAKLSASINPFVYSLNHPKIRKEMGRRFNCCCRHSGSASKGTSTSGKTTSRIRTRQSQRRESILHFSSRLASIQRRDESSYDLKEIHNYLHQSSQLLDKLHRGLVNGPSCSIEPRDLHYNHSLSNSRPKSEGTRRVRLSQSETTCCVDVHHLPSQTRPHNVTFQSESSNGTRQGNDCLGEKPIHESMNTVL